MKKVAEFILWVLVIITIVLLGTWISMTSGCTNLIAECVQVVP